MAYFGFRQSGGTGSAPTYEQVPVKVAYNAGSIFYGDPVEPLATGYIQRADGTTGTEGIAGIFVGCKYLSTSQKRTVWSNYWPGSDTSGDVEAYIINDPNATFIVNAPGIVAADVNANINYTIGTGDTATGISGAYASGAAATATLPFRIVALADSVTGGADNIIVRFNNVATKSTTGI